MRLLRSLGTFTQTRIDRDFRSAPGRLHHAQCMPTVQILRPTIVLTVVLGQWAKPQLSCSRTMQSQRMCKSVTFGGSGNGSYRATRVTQIRLCPRCKWQGFICWVLMNL